MTNNRYIIKFSKTDLRLLIISLIFFLGLFRCYLFTQSQFKLYSFFIMIVYLVLFGRNYKILKQSKFAFLFSIVIFISVIYLNISSTVLFNAILYFLQFFMIFVLTNYLTHKYGLERCIKAYMGATIILTLAMDISILGNIEFDPLRYQNLSSYIFGNKFMVAYLHIQTLGLASAYKVIKKNNKKMGVNKIWWFLYAIYSIFICSKVDCNTGMIGLVILGIFLLFPLTDKIKKFLSKPFNILIIMIIANILIIGGKFVLESSFVQYIIVEVLHEDLTLTGRTAIYEMLYNIISQKWLLGYGYNSDTITKLIGYGNAQNGILQYALDCGLIGCFVFGLNWYICIKKAEGQEKNIWPIFCLMYAFIVCSLVEVSFKFNFMIILAIMLSVPLDNNLEENEKRGD